ncbi:TetR family transcriptional regulator C-terminal domain-containing protein [Streptomyces sp. RFCAC02]|uniref:TetR family transcriptional regulator C-terminal domain-containing protein n=1 Tax=Streptomyces sp. RFCAC02 TaxID=2499143 RepID=UPI00101F447F|nr:TetR family transcriptional regulator C-terminal domain-containing protein [Streptomyces sp. RFCAC02]
MLTHVLEEQARREGSEDSGTLAELIVQVWGECLRDESLATTLRHGYEDMYAVWSDLVATYRAAGHLPADVPTEHLVRTLMALVQGFIVQQALFGTVSGEMLRNGLRTLMTADAAAQ